MLIGQFSPCLPRKSVLFFNLPPKSRTSIWLSPFTVYGKSEWLQIITVSWWKWLPAKACFYPCSPSSWNRVTWTKSVVVNYCIPKQRFLHGNQGDCIAPPQNNRYLHSSHCGAGRPLLHPPPSLQNPFLRPVQGTAGFGQCTVKEVLGTIVPGMKRITPFKQSKGNSHDWNGKIVLCEWKYLLTTHKTHRGSSQMGSQHWREHGMPLLTKTLFSIDTP